jgi:hypothetical protein
MEDLELLARVRKLEARNDALKHRIAELERAQKPSPAYHDAPAYATQRRRAMSESGPQPQDKDRAAREVMYLQGPWRMRSCSGKDRDVHCRCGSLCNYLCSLRATCGGVVCRAQSADRRAKGVVECVRMILYHVSHESKDAPQTQIVTFLRGMFAPEVGVLPG